MRWKSIKLKPFEYADITRLAELFQELIPRHPKLAIEKFANDHGIEPNLISRLIDGDDEEILILAQRYLAEYFA